MQVTATLTNHNIPRNGNNLLETVSFSSNATFNSSGTDNGNPFFRFTPTQNNIGRLLDVRFTIAGWGIISNTVGPVMPLRISGDPQFCFVTRASAYQNNARHEITITASGTIPATTHARPETGTNRTFIIRGENTDISITLGSDGGHLLSITGANVTIVDLILRGRPLNTNSLIHINAGTLRLNNSSVNSNHSGNVSGGGIHIAGGVVVLNNSMIIGNSTQGRGGGIVVNGGGRLEIINNTEISNNGSPTRGGGIAVNNGQVIMRSGSINNNGSRQNGGGVAIINTNRTTRNLARFDMLGGQIQDNIATTRAGGVTLYDHAASFRIQSGSVSGNAGQHDSQVYRQRDRHTWTEWLPTGPYGALQPHTRHDDFWPIIQTGNFSGVTGNLPSGWGGPNHHNFYNRSDGLLVIRGEMFEAARPSSGSCIPLWTLILTTSGLKKLSDLKVGDEIITKSTNGKITTDNVWHIWKSSHKEALHRIEFTDGTDFICDLSHIFEKKFRGPSSFNITETGRYLPLGKIKVGDRISAMNKWKTVKKIAHHSFDYIGEIYLEREYYYYAGENNITSWSVSGKMINKYVRDDELVRHYKWPQVKTKKGPWIVSEYIKVLINSCRLIL